MGKTAWTKRSTVEAVIGSLGGVPLDAASAMLRRGPGERRLDRAILACSFRTFTATRS